MLEMDNLRWILLAIAIVIIIAVYFFSRTRKKDQSYSPLDAVNEVPSFTANEVTEKSEWMDGVGPVRVVSSLGDNLDDVLVDEVNVALHEDKVNTREETGRVIDSQEKNDSDFTPQHQVEHQVEHQPEIEAEPEPESVTEDVDVPAEEPEKTDSFIDDVISVYVLAKSNQAIQGEKVLSASYALHLEFGDMKIFHRHSHSSQKDIQFSMANIKQPGWFEIDKMHELETPGVSFFMQVNLVDNASDVLDEMLICAHSLSVMLDATLCNAQRKPLDETYTNEKRKKVSHLEAIKTQS